MDSLLAPTKDDMKLILKRDYRQRQEQIRRGRIFNPKQRLIGIDKTALDQLVEEKQQKNVFKQKEEIRFSLEQNRLNEMIDSQLNEAHAEQQRIQCEMNEFRNRFQQKEQTREFDLNDPLHIRKMSASDSFRWLGLDPDCVHRKKMQQEQQKSWLNQQILEKMEAKMESSQVEIAMETCALNQEAQMQNNERTKQIHRQKNQLDTARFNQSLAQAQKQKRLEARRHEDEDNLAEIMNSLCSDMLTENKESGVYLSLFGGSRITTSMYRGMTDEQLHEIRSEQLQQIKDKQSNKAKQKENDLLFDENDKNRLKLFEIQEQEIQKKRNHLFSLQNSTNMHLQSHQKQRNHYLNKNVYKFTPTEDFFNQFNTTSR